jgi:hypothetical protein
MKIKFLPFICLIAAGLLILATPQMATAQDQAPPGRVADLDYMQGSVSYEPAGEQNWVDAETNRPLTTGDSLWSDQSSRAELFIGSTALRMGDSTGISFLNLNDQVAQVQLAEGTLEVNVRYLNSDESYEIDTPNLAFSVSRPGDYVINADPNGGMTSVAVYAGEGSVTGGGQTYNITPGQDAVFTGTNQLSENIRGVAYDSFENWARSREMVEEHAQSARYVAPGVTGYEDLDQYGSWRSDPDYGEYWVPNDVSSGWVPYHVGHWAWIAPWGWTWVDQEPWGFAPFHYGRWAVIDGSWGWVPGPVAVAPVYAPALVGFVGGGGFGVAVSFGSVEGVGWFPLGPRDVYVPPYRVDPRYVEEINHCDTRYYNQTRVTNVYNNYTVNHVTYANYQYANNSRAVTVVNRQAFVSGQPVQRGAIRVNQQQIQHPRVVTTAALTPTRASVVGAVARAHAAPRVAPAAQHVVTRLKPSPRAEPIGKPRPRTNPQLATAALQRSGYSPQLQLVHARAAAGAPARAPAGKAAPARPGTLAARPAPSRPAPGRPTPAKPPVNRAPARPMARPANPARPNARPAAPTHPAVPPAARRPENNRPAFPNRQPRPNTPGARPFTPPNRPPARTSPPTREPNREPARPNRPATRPQPQPRPAMPPHTRPSARPAEPRPAPRPQREVRPSARPAPRPAARPRPQPERRPPPKKKPGGGSDGNRSL